MESCWGVLMLLGVAVATTTSPPPPQQMLSYEEAVSLAIDLYNQGPDIDFAFRLLEAEAQPDWVKGVCRLEFTVKETECPVSENLLLDQCNFRGNGVVRACSGTISTDPQAPLVLLTCDTVAQEVSFPFGRCGAGSGSPHGNAIPRMAAQGHALGAVSQERLWPGLIGHCILQPLLLLLHKESDTPHILQD
uniref:Vipericidin n=1 Tax=Chelydra serpentina TaxID=8475 RepID=A0A8C3RZG9_CHESE